MGVSCGLAAAAAAGVCRPADLLPTPAVAARSKRLRWPISTQAEPQQICSIDSWQSGVFPSRRGKPWNSPCCFPKQMPVCSPSHLKGSSCLFNGLPPGKPSLLVSHKKSKYYLMNWLLNTKGSQQPLITGLGNANHFFTTGCSRPTWLLQGFV